MMNKTLQEKIAEAIAYISTLRFEEMELGRHDVNEEFYVNLQAYNTKAFEDTRFEAHRQYVDVQFMVEGTERIDVAAAALLEVEDAYDEQVEAMFLKAPKHAASVVLTAGGYVVLYPEDAHRPGISVQESVPVKKIIGKVRV